MTLTDDQKLEMTETIARACGWRIDIEDGFVWMMKDGRQTDTFQPFFCWDHVRRALSALLPLADYSVSYVHYHTDDPWVQVTISIWTHPECGGDPEYEGNGADELEALAAALHEIAKAKLE